MTQPAGELFRNDAPNLWAEATAFYAAALFQFMMRLTAEERVCKLPVLRVKSTLFHGLAFQYRF